MTDKGYLPAFPISGGQQYPQMNGMTLRDYFAGQALNQATRDIWAEHKPEDVAKRAYQFADAMLAEREKGSGQ